MTDWSGTDRPSRDQEDGLQDSDDALSAEFRTRLGLLPDEDEGLSDLFKARVGFQGLDEIGQVEEMELGLSWEKDETIRHFKFEKFTKEHFQNGVGSFFTTEPLTAALLTKKHEVDGLASLAVWLAIQRFMGDIPTPNDPPPRRDKVPIMTKIYRTLEAHVKRRNRGAELGDSTVPQEQAERISTVNGKRKGLKSLFSRSKHKSDPTKETVSLKRNKSSWKKFFSGGKDKGRSGGGKDSDLDDAASSGGSTMNFDIEYSTNHDSMLSRIPTTDLDLVHFVVGHGILRREMRDEIFAQLCKQLTDNPSSESQTRGWMMLSMAAGCFVPSDLFLKYLQCFVKDAPAEFKETYAPYAKSIIIRTLANGLRYHPPNWLELQATKIRKHVLLPVTFADGRTETLDADSATTASEMCNLLANKIGLKDQFGFSIYICIYDKVSSLGNGMDHVMDAISECEQVVRSKGQKEEDAPWRLYFRKEVFTPWHDPAYDDVSTSLVYQQVARGIKNGEYRIKTEDKLCEVAAQRYYVDQGQSIVPGKLQASLHQYIPDRKLKESSKNRDGWTQAIMSSFEEQGFSSARVPASKVKEDFVMAAPRRWPMHFSALFEAFKISGPRLPRNDVVVAVNSVGVFIMDEPYRVVVGMTYFEIVEVFCSRTGKMRGQSFSLVTVKGDEFTFISPNSQAIADLVSNFLIGLRRRSKYAVGLQEFIFQGVNTPDPFRFKQGDLLILMENVSDQTSSGRAHKEDWAYGMCERTQRKGSFPLDCIYILPALERPPDEFLSLFLTMTSQDTQTLPRKRGAVVLGTATIGRHGAHGKDSAA